MKKRFFLFAALLAATGFKGAGQLSNPVNVTKRVTTDHANQQMENGAQKGVSEAENGIKKMFSKKNKGSGAVASTAAASSSPAAAPPAGGNGDGYKAYSNYDFVAGETILFEDNFSDDQDGEFPAHWQLKGGQAVVNKMGEEKMVAITKYYTELAPRMKTASYVPSEFTVELDEWLDDKYDSNPGVGIHLNTGTEHAGVITIDHSHVTMEYPGGKLQGDMPAAIAVEAFHNKWHHIAIAFRNKQIKVYCDQYRILVVPDCNMVPASLSVWGNASDGMNMMFKNFKLAKGCGMNAVNKKFTDAKIITHGIQFDLNSASIKPSSMGVINSIVKIMNDNPDVKFEVGGHTDADGADAYNMTLSQQRADAVRERLISLGISASRLTARGYGESKPVADNNTPEGKANNRRVEFVKI